MQAVVFDESGLRVTNDHPQPDPGHGEVLVRVTQAGICETDLQLVRGYMGFSGVLGHEFVGVAEGGQFVGQRVVGEINCNCRNCEFCGVDLGNHCPHRSVIGILNHDGAFANYVRVPEHNLHVVPDNLSDEHAVFVEPVAAAFQIPKQIELRPDMRTIVLGDGRLGNLCAQVLRHHGCDPLVVGKHPEKLGILDTLGIRTTLLADVPQERNADLVVDVTGSPTGIESAISLVRPRGTIVLKTTVADLQTFSLAPVVIDEITIVGSRCGPFAPAVKALADGAIQVEPLISSRRPMSDAVAAFDEATQKNMLKVLLQP